MWNQDVRNAPSDRNRRPVKLDAVLIRHLPTLEMSRIAARSVQSDQSLSVLVRRDLLDFNRTLEDTNLYSVFVACCKTRQVVGIEPKLNRSGLYPIF